jgi:hypothetical protein
MSWPLHAANAGLRTAHEQLRLVLEAKETEIAALRGEVEQLREQVADLAARVNALLASNAADAARAAGRDAIDTDMLDKHRGWFRDARTPDGPQRHPRQQAHQERHAQPPGCATGRLTTAFRRPAGPVRQQPS